MEDFDLLEQAIKECGELKPQEKNSPRVRVHSQNPWPEEEQPERCKHENITLDKNNTICVECGEELEANTPFDKEWRFYGGNDNKYSSDPNRCQIRKISERSIYKDIEGMGLSEKIVTLANDIYAQVTDGGIHRGVRRKSIIFACIRQAYKISGKPQTLDALIGPFNIQRKAALKGIKHVNMKVPKNFRQTNFHITPIDLLEQIMKIFDAKPEQVEGVLSLYPLIIDKSAMLNGSRPWSLSSGLVYYWIVKNEKNISIKDFSSKVDLSELTVKKIYTEIKRVLLKHENKV